MHFVSHSRVDNQKDSSTLQTKKSPENGKHGKDFELSAVN